MARPGRGDCAPPCGVVRMMPSRQEGGWAIFSRRAWSQRRGESAVGRSRGRDVGARHRFAARAGPPIAGDCGARWAGLKTTEPPREAAAGVPARFLGEHRVLIETTENAMTPLATARRANADV